MRSARNPLGKWLAIGWLAGLCWQGVSPCQAEDVLVLPTLPVPVSKQAVLGQPTELPENIEAVRPPEPVPPPNPAPPPVTPDITFTPPEGIAPDIIDSIFADDKTPAPRLVVLPPVNALPRPGYFVLPPGACYFSLCDDWNAVCRETPLQHPYPRSAFMPGSFFDADFRYLYHPDNEEYDVADFLKLRPQGTSWLLTSGGEVRVRYADDHGGSRVHGQDNSSFLTRARVFADLWYHDQFRIYAEFLDARSFDQEQPPLATDVNRADVLNLFVDVKLGCCDGQGVYLRCGRQELLFGSERLISTEDWTNTRRTFQGVRGFWHGEQLDLDLFCVQPVVPAPSRFDAGDNNQVFSGAWATYRPAEGQHIDAYFLNLDRAGSTPDNLGNLRGPFNVNTLGGRYAGDSCNWLWDLEAMLQFGSYASQSAFARAYTTGVGYHFKDCCVSPQFWLYYDYASGDPTPGEGSVNRTFNQLFPFGHYYFGAIDAVGRQNIHDFSTQVAFFPAPWLIGLVQYHVFRLDQARDGLYNAAGLLVRSSPTGGAGTDVGEEIDLLLDIHVSSHQNLAVGYSHLFAGDFLRLTSPSLSGLDFFFVQYTFRW